jgi:protein-disulfide isomerase/uncharacterized membrane protein
MSLAGALKERLRAYRPVWEHVLFGLSMLGVLTVVHLYIQQGREFDRGCFGFAGLESGHLGFDCSSVLASGSGTFLGLSNTTWGFGFYLTIAVLTMAIFLVGEEIRSWLQGLRGIGIAGGAVYSGYLVYVQVAVIEALCALCLTSAAIATLLLVVQGTMLIRYFHPSASTMPTRLFKRDLTIYVYLAAITAVLVGADFAYFRALAPADTERAAVQQEQFSGAACQLDPKKDPVSDPSSLVSFDDVTKGPTDASVTVVEYFDPNCPHCKTFHETMKTLVAEYKDEVQFVYKPFPLRGSSLPEIQALYVANREGKFSEMLDAQYARQSRTGITKQDLQDIAGKIGMNPDVLMTRIEEDKYRKMIIQNRQRAIEIGVNSTPTVLINGHFAGSRSAECMRLFIQRAQKGTLGTASASSK